MMRRAVILLLGSVVLLPALAVPSPSPLTIRRANDAIEVVTGTARWLISTTDFSVIRSSSVAGEERLRGGGASVSFLGSRSRFGPPETVTTGGDWIELRGWVDRGKRLWYVARYQFFPGEPLSRLVLTLTDRHDTTASRGPWDASWADRVVSDWRLELNAPGGRPQQVTQHNSYSASSAGGPWIDVVNASGAPYQWVATPRLDAARIQLVHQARDGANQVLWYPASAGPAEVIVEYSGLPAAEQYKAARGVTYEVTDAAGKTSSMRVDQGAGRQRLSLGTFVLGRESVVRLKATGVGGEAIAVAGSVRVVPANGDRPIEVRPGLRRDGVLTDGAITLVVKDFWQHHPISLVRTPRTIGWRAIERPERLAGGMGLTLETMIAVDGPASNAVAALYEPPERRLPSWMDPVDGSLATGTAGARYDALLRDLPARVEAELELGDAFGWRNWGDYQIGPSYSTKSGPVEDWANLQYDLASGLLMAWLRTGDQRLWRYAQASVRHLMDVDYVKFSPFPEKLNNLVFRKGEMPKSQSHVGTEPIVDQGFAFRSLLLYHALTGEAWARDLAKEHIDRLAYYGVTRPRFVLAGDRPAAWMLRGALAGARHFSGDRRYDYARIADALVSELLAHYRATGRLPGAQPVWQGQLVEGLVQYHERTRRADVADAIVGHARYLVTDALRRRGDGTWEFLYCSTPGKPVCPTPAWTSEWNYAFLWLGTLSAAFTLSRDPLFAGRADALFTYAAGRLKAEGGIRHWTSALGFPHLYLERSAGG
jgi:hypothetical protein